MQPGTLRSVVLTAAQFLAAILAVLVLGSVLPRGVEGVEVAAVFVIVVVLMGVNYVYWAVRDGWWLPSLPSSPDPEGRREELERSLVERRDAERRYRRRDDVRTPPEGDEEEGPPETTDADD